MSPAAELPPPSSGTVDLRPFSLPKANFVSQVYTEDLLQWMFVQHVLVYPADLVGVVVVEAGVKEEWNDGNLLHPEQCFGITQQCAPTLGVGPADSGVGGGVWGRLPPGIRYDRSISGNGQSPD